MFTKIFFRYSFLILLLFETKDGFSQSEHIIPTTPEAAALSKSINIPVGYDTGIPEISIPLHQINVGGMTIPISLNYHAGGFRVGEVSSNVGMGWSISTELQITRTVAGKDDFDNTNYKGYYYNNSIGSYKEGNPSMPNATISDAKLLARIARGDEDYQPDIFRFSIPGKSGTFFFLKKIVGSTSSVRAVTIPYSDMIIDYNPSSQSFTLTDIDGAVYYFGDEDFWGSRERTTINADPNTQVITSWKCVKIITPSKKDEIILDYVTKPADYNYSFPDRIEVFENSDYTAGTDQHPIVYADDFDSWGSTHIASTPFEAFACPKFYNYSLGGDKGFYMVIPPADPYSGDPGTVELKDLNNGQPFNPGTRTVSVTDGLSLSSITFRGGHVDYGHYSDGRINSIKIFDVENTEVKSIELVQSLASSPPTYDLSNSGYVYKGTSYLDEVRFKKGTQTFEKYGLEYWLVNNVKPAFKNSSKMGDPWGYVNSSTYPSLITFNAVPQQTVYSTQQNEDFEWTLGNGNFQVSSSNMGMLKKIIYPGGGYTTFDFEPNQYEEDAPGGLAGGKRIKSIKNYDGISSVPVTEKIYKYGENENGFGLIKCKPSVSTINGQEVINSNYSYKQIVKYGTFIDGTLPEWREWDHTFTEEKTTYLPNSYLDLSYSSGSPVRYTEVAVYQKDLGQSSGKTIYKYETEGFSPVYIKEGTNLKIKLSDWHLGTLKEEQKFKYAGNGQYDIVYNKEFDYDEFALPDQVYCGYVFQKTIYNDLPTGEYWDPVYGLDDFDYVPIGRRVGAMRLKKETETWVEDGQTLVKTTDYYYNDLARMRANRVETTMSNGKTDIAYYTYPKDYDQSGTDFIHNLVSNNMVYAPVETVKAVRTGSSTVITSGLLSTYRKDNTGLIEKAFSLEINGPLELSQFKFSNRSVQTGNLPAIFEQDSHYQQKTAFEYDDKSNIKLIQPTFNAKKGYKWGYNQLYPIAEISNGGDEEIFVENFEDGTWTQNGGHTGVRSKTGDHSVFWNPPNSRVYVISYWYKEDGSWKFSGEIPYTGSSYDANLGDAVDDICIYPSDVQMTTYTYKPLVGMSSMTDARGVSFFYYYDDVQRLSTIQDGQGNIVKQFCYSYANNIVECKSDAPAWSTTGTECVIVNGSYTGEQLDIQQDVNPKSLTYGKVRKQSLGNTGQCVGAVNIYARLEPDSERYFPYENGWDDYGEYCYAWQRIRFYSDSNCNLPMNLPFQITVNGRRTYTGFDGSQQTFPLTATGYGGWDQTWFGDFMTYHYHDYVYDYDYEYWTEETESNTFDLLPGSNYTITY